MSTGPIVRTTPFGGAALARALLDGRTPPWIAPPPRDAAAWRARIDAVRGEHDARDWLAPLADAWGASGAAARRLADAAARGIVITTGQQPGLFGGPMLTWGKALSALAFADALEALTGVPVAPVFWAATDDADVVEGSTTYVAVRGGVEAIALDAVDAPDGTSVRDIPLGDLTRQLDAMARASGAAIDQTPLDLARRAYRAGTTIGGAYVALLRAMLEPLGIAVLDAGHPAVREAAHPLLERALARAGAIDAALAARDDEIERAGFTSQVQRVPQLTLVFEYDGATRRRIPLTTATTRRSSGTLGPNVLLRPIVERAILPTVAYLAGPAELGYFAQVTAVASALGVDPPIALPRWTGMIVEPHVQRILERYELSPERVRQEGVAERIVAERRLPQAIEDSLGRTRETLATSVGDLARVTRESDFPLPESVIAGLEATVRRRLERFERRVMAAQKRREQQAMDDIVTARSALFPFGKSQERVLNLLPLLARHGTPLFDAILDRAREHAARALGAGSPEAVRAAR